MERRFTITLNQNLVMTMDEKNTQYFMILANSLIPVIDVRIYTEHTPEDGLNSFAIIRWKGHCYRSYKMTIQRTILYWK